MISLYLKFKYTAVGENVDIVIQKCCFLCVESQWLENTTVPEGSALPPDPEETEPFMNDSSSEAFSLLLGTFSHFAVYYENHPFSSVLPAKRGPNPELWLKTRPLYTTPD